MCSGGDGRFVSRSGVVYGPDRRAMRCGGRPNRLPFCRHGPPAPPARAGSRARNSQTRLAVQPWPTAGVVRSSARSARRNRRRDALVLAGVEQVGDRATQRSKRHTSTYRCAAACGFPAVSRAPRVVPHRSRPLSPASRRSNLGVRILAQGTILHGKSLLVMSRHAGYSPARDGVFLRQGPGQKTLRDSAIREARFFGHCRGLPPLAKARFWPDGSFYSSRNRDGCCLLPAWR